jgi:hypothetical protein
MSPRSDPRGAKTAPRAARSRPRAPQEPPKRSKKGLFLMLGRGKKELTSGRGKVDIREEPFLDLRKRIR